MKYKKLNGGNDSKSKELVKKMFKQVYGWNMEMTSKFCYLDGVIRLGNKVIGVEIKDRSNSYDSHQFDDVVCETYKYNKYLYDKKHPNTAEIKGIVKMLAIHLYRDGIMFIGDADCHTIIERMANKTTEFHCNDIVKKQFLSIRRKIGLEMDGFKCIYNEQKSGDYFTWKRNFYTIERELGIQNEILEEKV